MTSAQKRAKRNHKRWRLNRAAVLRQQGGRCAFCPAPIDEVHHIQPIQFGGSDALENLQGVCARHHILLHEHQEVRWWAKQKCQAHGLPLLLRPKKKRGAYGLNFACQDPQCAVVAGVPDRLRRYRRIQYRPTGSQVPRLAPGGDSHGPGDSPEA